MPKIVHARLDEESQKILHRIASRTGWADSTIIRRGIRAPGNETDVPAARQAQYRIQRRARIRHCGSGVQQKTSKRFWPVKSPVLIDTSCIVALLDRSGTPSQNMLLKSSKNYRLRS